MHEPVPHPRLALLLAALAVLIGRGLSQALPGTLTGLDPMIDRVSLAGAVLTQLGAALLAALALRSATLLLFTRPGQPLLRFVSAATATLVVMLTLFAALLSHNQLAPHWSMLAAVIVAGTLSWSGASALKRVDSRAVGLIAIFTATAATVHTLSRIQALIAAERASTLAFGVARAMATAGFALEVACVVAAYCWLLFPRSTAMRAGAGIVIAIAPAIALGATADGGFALVVERLLAQLSAHPDPLVPRLLRDSVELWGLGAVALSALSRTRPPELLLVLGLCLLGRASADIPLGALFLMNAALTLQLHVDPAPGSQAPLGAEDDAEATPHP